MDWLANAMAICKQIALSHLSPSLDLFFSGPLHTAGWLALTPDHNDGSSEAPDKPTNLVNLGAAKGWVGLEESEKL